MTFQQFTNQYLLQQHKCLPNPQEDLNQPLYDLHMDFLSQKDVDAARAVNSLDETAQVRIVAKDLIEHLDRPGFDLRNTLNLSANLSNSSTDNQRFLDCQGFDPAKSTDFLANLEEMIGFTDDQTPEVRLVQHEEGDQFFELVREPSTYLEDKTQRLETEDSNSHGMENNQDMANDTSKHPNKRKKKRPTKNKNTGKFECTICNKKFITTSNLKQHMGSHSVDKKNYHCKLCDMSFAWKSTLNKHLASSHRPDGPQKFVCEICPRVYATLAQVNEHVKRDHLKVRNHECKECGKTFFKKFDLKLHIRTHTKERPYVCRFCDKTFYHQSHIIRHERTHSGERPYSCSVCLKTFLQLSALKAHRMTHQNERQMDILDFQNSGDQPMGLSGF